VITAADRRTYLRTLAWDAQDQQVSLFSVLKAAMRGQFSLEERGKFVMATSGNGRSSQFFMPDFFKTLTTDDVRTLFDCLMNVYLQTYQGLGLVFPVNPAVADNDQAIFDRMMQSKWMQTVTSSYPDWSNYLLRQVDGCEEGAVSW
jgi:hypothetical protein